jgi:hypothetical protein
VSENWTSLDPVACGQWLQTLPSDDSRSSAIEAYVSQAAQKRPDLAAQWVGSIPDEKQRNQQIEAIARQWLKTAPEAAQAWLDQIGLAPEMKARLVGR